MRLATYSLVLTVSTCTLQANVKVSPAKLERTDGSTSRESEAALKASTPDDAKEPESFDPETFFNPDGTNCPEDGEGDL